MANVHRGLKRSHESCMSVAKKKRRLVEAKRHRWTEHQIEDKEEEIDYITSRGCTYEHVLEGRNEASFERRVNYEIKKLIMSKRLMKARRSGPG